MMAAPASSLKTRTYNVHAMSFTPNELFNAVRKWVPDLKIEYKIDGRQSIGENNHSFMFNFKIERKEILYISTNLYGSLWFVVRPGVCGDQGFDTHLTYVVQFV